MFEKLKAKLKESFSIFSRKAEEEAEVKEIVVEKEVPVEKKVEHKIEKPVVKEEKKVSKPVEKKEVPEKKKEEPRREEKKLVKEEKKKVESHKEKIIPPKEEKKVETIKKEEKPVIKEEKKKIEEKEKEVIVPKQEVKKTIIESDIPLPLKEEKDIVPEKKSFFGKIKSVFVKEEKIEPKEVKEEKAEVKEKEAEEKKVIEEKVIEVVKERKEEKEKKKEEYKEEKEAEREIETVEEKEAVEEKDLVEEEKEEAVEEEPEHKGFFGRIKEKLTTKTISAEKFEELFWELEVALLENNVSVAVIEKIKEDLKIELVEKPLPRDVEKKIEETLQKTLREILSTEKIDILSRINEHKKSKKPYVVAFFGINGSGKTTSIAKLTHYLQQKDKSVVLAACDTFRAAAIQQLGEHAEKLGVKMISHDYGADAAAVAYDAVKYAEKNNIDVVLIDTAGRLHSNTNLMAELDKIIRVAKPDMKIFVGESITGNDCIEQAQKFNDLVELDGVILTKADVDEKGGAPLSIAYTIKKPIMFLGMGQKYSDLEVFDKDVILGRLGL